MKRKTRSSSDSGDSLEAQPPTKRKKETHGIEQQGNVELGCRL